MSKFIQLHLLTSYGPANLNRDDLGRPKTAFMGGVERLRISSQSLKRAWRTSDLFEESMKGHVGTRTKLLGVEVYDYFIQKGVSEKTAGIWTKGIAGKFGKLKKEDKEHKKKGFEIEQLVHISPTEKQNIFLLADTLITENREPTTEELELLQKDKQAVDIALFGRMLTKNDNGESNVKYCIEAATQVAHALTVHGVAVEDDYFTAVDDLNTGMEDAGSAHIGESGFGAGVFYSYICINKTLLEENLKDNDLAEKAIQSLVSCAAQVAPTGKQNSYASRARASYLLAEKGGQQPRQLSTAFLKPINSKNVMNDAIKSLEDVQKNMDKIYGSCADVSKSFNVEKGEGSLEEILNFIAE